MSESMPVPFNESGDPTTIDAGQCLVIEGIETAFGMNVAEGDHGIPIGAPIIGLTITTDHGVLPVLVFDVDSFHDEAENFGKEFLQRVGEAHLLHNIVIDEKVQCPGCGQRLFGVVKARGACLGCFPEVPN